MQEPPLPEDKTIEISTDRLLLSRIIQEQHETNRWLRCVFETQRDHSYWLRSIHLFLIIILVLIGLSICGGIVSVTQ